MSNFLFHDPEAVFIHIPKNAGTSIRFAWRGRCSGAAFGYIPHEWSGIFSFAFARHPLDRLVSAWLMFSEGTSFGPKGPKRRSKLLSLIGLDYPERDLRAKLPGISLKDFLAILADERIDYDYARHQSRRLPANVGARHHGIPQTHPYNCLGKADFVGRYETLEADFARIAERLGGGLSMAHLRRTRREKRWHDYFDKETLDMAVEYYRDDFRELGYELPAHQSRRPS